MIGRGVITVAAVAFALSSAAVARASEPLPDLNVRAPTLKASGKRALVEYTTARGVRRHVFVWGAINSRVPPRADVRQARFRYDFAGGWRIARKQLWRGFRNRCRRYDGPPLPYLVVACKAPDGSYWALQSWQRRLPLLGFDAWLPAQDDYELHVSHWNTELPVLEAYVNWTYGFQWQGVFGRLSYLGHPVYGFGSSTRGEPARPVRAERLHRHVELGVRAWMEARVGGPHAPRDRDVLPQLRVGAAAACGVSVLGAAAVFAGGAISDLGHGTWGHADADVGGGGVPGVQRELAAPGDGAAGERGVRPADGGGSGLRPGALERRSRPWGGF